MKLTHLLLFLGTFLALNPTTAQKQSLQPIMGQEYEKKIDNSLLKDDKLRIYFCGTGNPKVTMQDIRKPACLAILTKDDFFVIDAGEGTSQTLAKLGLPYPAIDKAFMTHWHSDHMAGLAALINNTWKDGRKTPFFVYGPYGVEQVVNGFNQAYQLDNLYRGINSSNGLDLSIGGGVPKLIDQKETPVKVYEQGNIELSAFVVDHPPVYPAIGYSLKYKGCHIVISGDTKVVETLAQASEDADVLINEALSDAIVDESISQFKKNPDFSEATKQKDITLAQDLQNYHSGTYALAKMAEQSKAKRLFLTHLTPAIFNTAEDKAKFTTNMDQYYKGPITVVDDGDSLLIESDGKGCKVQYIPVQQAAADKL
ncbi:MAG: MBL fold metallo-hydrolase [Proteobacteria bacterium]|nr:MBL fold metallo-hydrolase [Pseudomonadota bacterium]